jgi:ADP-heptose:LPS heptosyltransferase
MKGSLSSNVAPRQIVLFRALFLGDLLCAVPTFRALRRRFPRAEITLIGLPWARQLVDRLGCLDRFEPFPGFPGLDDVPHDPERTAAFLARMRERRFDLAIQLHGSGRVSNEVVAALGADLSLGFGAPDDDRLSVVVPWRDEEHEIRRWLRLVAAVGAATDDTTPAFPVTSDEQRQADRLLAALPPSRGPIVGLHPGAKDPARRWPAARFAALGDALNARFGARLVLTGGPDERHLSQAVRDAMGVPALDLTGRTDLGTFAALIARLDLLVTNDTGASHLAAAARTRSVVLFGPSRPERWAPLDITLHTAIDAAALPRAAADHQTALAALPVQPVLAACGGALNHARTVHPAPAVAPKEAAWRA